MTPPETSSPAQPDPRLHALADWLQTLPGDYALAVGTMRPASSDASFRRYFRIDSGNPGHPSLIAMDAPAPMEDCRPFVHAASVFGQAGMSVPRVLESDLARGFLLLDDLGTRTYLDELDEARADAMYADAGRALLSVQLASRPGTFPEYDRELLLRELMLYPDWYVTRHKGVELDPGQLETLRGVFETLLASNLAQPRVYVHRDYHSRNLMVLDGDANPGVLDFQDAVYGPITYDLVSLLRDAYVKWPEQRVIDWAVRQWERSRAAGLPVSRDFSEFYRDFEWMGLQRHLKVLGIFARLCHRDGKDRYLDDLPLVLEYVVQVASRYAAFSPLLALIEQVESRASRVGYTF
jgi:aminoglycoside/choline kinase family phosphotransferase